MLSVVFWVVTPCDLVCGYCFAGTITFIFRDQLTLKMEAIHSSEMLVTTYKTTQYHNPENQD
jgi:hypothetical protein